MVKPIIKELSYCDPIHFLETLPADKGIVFLDSAVRVGSNRYSFIAYDPFSILSCSDGQVDIDGKKNSASPFVVLLEQLALFQIGSHDCSPFVGGLAGYVGYEAVKYIEPKIKLRKKDEREIPDYLLGAFDLVLAFDHLLEKVWLISSGLPEMNEALRLIRAKERADFLLELLARPSVNEAGRTAHFAKCDIISNITYEAYCAAIEKVLEYIRAGDIYQANIAQRFQTELLETVSPVDLYKCLRTHNPAPFAAFVRLNNIMLVSASPERFLRVKDRHVMACPIKGTSRRDASVIRDQQLVKALACCPKNQAENLMIVDLMRNDLSRVCELHSIHVPHLFSLESYATLHHLVSTIEGRLKRDYNLIDLLSATFPGGSVSGAPKKRAIEIIDEIETCARGPYCGSLGYLGFNGMMDTSIIIRTFVIKNRQVTFHVGGGIVADSNPHDEYAETLTKAKALYATLISDGTERFSL